MLEKIPSQNECLQRLCSAPAPPMAAPPRCSDCISLSNTVQPQPYHWLAAPPDAMSATLYQTLLSPSPTTGRLSLHDVLNATLYHNMLSMAIITISPWVSDQDGGVSDWGGGVSDQGGESLTRVEESLNGVEESLTGMEEDLCWVYKAGMTNTKNPPVPAELIIAAQTRQSGSEHITCENCRTQPGQGRGWRWTWGTWWGSWWSQASLCGRNLKVDHSFFFFTFFLSSYISRSVLCWWCSELWSSCRFSTL